MEAEWIDKIHAQLMQRDLSQRTQLKGIIESYNKAALSSVQMNTKLSLVNRELLEARTLISTIGDPKDSGVASKKYLELEQKYQEIKEERTELYKQHSHNSQRLLQLNETLRMQEEQLKAKDEKISSLIQQIESIKMHSEKCVQSQKEKEITIQVLQDELTALQLELIQTEERINKVECENKTLVDRWMQKMNEEAEAMNEKIENETKDHLEAAQIRVAECSIPVKFTPLATFHKGAVNCLAVTESTFATGGDDSLVCIYNLDSQEIKTKLQGSLKAITSLCYCPSNADLILGSSEDCIARIWGVSSGRIKHTFTGHVSRVNTAQFSENSVHVATGSHDRTIKIWDFSRGYCTRTIFAVSVTNDCKFINDGMISSAHLDQSLRFWDVQGGALVKEIPNYHAGQIVGIEKMDNEILTLGRDNKLNLMDLRTFSIIRSYHEESFSISSNYSKASFSPDGKFVISGGNGGFCFIWNKLDGTIVSRLNQHSSAIVSALWNPKGGPNIISCDQDGSMVLGSCE